MNLDKLYKTYCHKNPKPIRYEKWLEKKLIDATDNVRELAGFIYKEKFYLYHEMIGKEIEEEKPKPVYY